MTTNWTYGLIDGTEYAVWNGEKPACLRAHFHLEEQITLVLAGMRRFATPFGILTAHAGEGIIFPAGLVHSAPDISADCECVNFYYLPKTNRNQTSHKSIVFSLDNEASELARNPRRAREVADKAMPHGHTCRDETPLASAAKVLLSDTDLPVADIACRLGLSREGFSRAFATEVGVAPQTYRLIDRLNFARATLKSGASASAAAYEVGFSDQSHMTRVFRAAFGVSPGIYRAALI